MEPSSQIKVPPQFLEGERAILAGLLIDNEALSKIMAVVAEDDFYKEAHRILFRTMRGLFERNEPVDWVTLTNALQKEGLLESIGGPPFLSELADAVPSAANILHYAQQVKERAVLRELISASTEISTRCFSHQGDIGEFLDEAEQMIFRIGESRIQSGFAHVQDLMTDSIKTIENLYHRKENITGVPTGFPDLDKFTAGFQPSDLIIIAGRPSMGKTSLALNVALYASREGTTPTGVFSLEMSKEQIALRLLCATARVNLGSVRRGYLGQDDWPKLASAAGVISDSQLFIDDTPALGTLELRAKARRLKKEKGLGLLIVDYLQLMKSSARSESREKEISEISRSLKALAKELSVPVIALSQLNRKVEDRPNKRPQLADLRESGAIEQDADVIIFIYRDEHYNDSPENPLKGQAEIIIGKQRNGPTGTVKSYFDKEYSSFRPFTDREEPSPEDSAYMSEM